jgi:hypothetical protein
MSIASSIFYASLCLLLMCSSRRKTICKNEALNFWLRKRKLWSHSCIPHCVLYWKCSWISIETKGRIVCSSEKEWKFYCGFSCSAAFIFPNHLWFQSSFCYKSDSNRWKVVYVTFETVAFLNKNTVVNYTKLQVIPKNVKYILEAHWPISELKNWGQNVFCSDTILDDGFIT